MDEIANSAFKNWPHYFAKGNMQSRGDLTPTPVLEATLDGPLSGLATEILKDPYKLDFLFNAKELVLSITIFCFQCLAPDFRL